MARKRTMNRKELRTDYDEAEAKPEDEEAEEAEEEEEEAEEEEEPDAEVDEDAGDEEEAPKPKKPKKKAAAPKRTRTPKVVAMKAVWVVFDNSSKQIETFPYNEHTEALAFVEQKNTDKKGAVYLQMVKVPLEEKKEKEEKETKKGK
jgi:hypothetical protein